MGSIAPDPPNPTSDPCEMTSLFPVPFHKTPAIFAVVVAVNEYHDPRFPRLQSAVPDAKKLVNFLQHELRVPQENIKTLYDGEATRDAIINTITSVPASSAFAPDDALLVYFTGFAGKAKIERAQNVEGARKFAGMICSVDTNIGNATGISDSTLTHLFGQISRSSGNNITLLLDCESDSFYWGDPASFVVVAPEEAIEIETGGAFTEALITVLQAEKKAGRLEFLTVQSLADRAQVIHNNGRIHCFGRYIDHYVFNRRNIPAFHTFILGHVEVGGEITLTAGTAQGIQPNMKMAIFASNFKDTTNPKQGELVVESVSTTTAVLRRQNAQALPPPIFYAVETYYPSRTLKIALDGFPDGLEPPELRWIAHKIDQSSDAHVTVRFDKDDRVTLLWHGLEGEQRGVYRTSLHYPVADHSRIERMLARAARFTYHLSRSSPARSSLAAGLHIEFKSYENDQHLLTNGFLALTLEPNETIGPYSITISNTTKIDLWPYVFAFDPGNFTIMPWYLPSPAAFQAPLAAGKTLDVGSVDQEGLLFRASPSPASEISYIKVFATKERTDFSFLKQLLKSPSEDRLREFGVLPFGNAPDNLEPLELPDMNDDAASMLFGAISAWTDARVAIIRKTVVTTTGCRTTVSL